MKIIKRNGTEVTYDLNKIIVAIKKANDGVLPSERLSEDQIALISENVEKACLNINRSLNVEEIQDMVENQIMDQKAFDCRDRRK